MIRLALWQMRWESRKVWLVLFCVALGVSARVAVGSFLSELRRSLLLEARGLLSCDLEILSRTPIDSQKRRELDQVLKNFWGTGYLFPKEIIIVSPEINFLTMASAAKTGKSRLVELR